MAYTSPNMGLRVWNLLSDPYDHDQLADNMARIDFHDHSPGRGHPIPSEALNDLSITSAKLSNAATIKGVGAFRAHRAASLSLTTDSAIVWDTEQFDFSNWFDVGTGRYTPQVAGYYRIAGQVKANAALGAVGRFWRSKINKNASGWSQGTHIFAHTDVSGLTSVFNDVIPMNGTTDYIEIRIEHDVGAAHPISIGGPTYLSYVTGHLVGRS